MAIGEDEGVDRIALTASLPSDLRNLDERICECRRCPRLVAWREEVACVRRSAYADQQYWGRPVPGFGDPAARLLVLGLAPAAHGANRTGRVFTGDRSGDWLFRALYRAGLANQPISRALDDGLQLRDVWVTAAVKCAPPANRPTVDERERCSVWLTEEIALLARVRAVLCLGAFGFDAACRHFDVRPRPRFGHGVEVELGSGTMLIGSYHPSQQNTFTGRLTEAMLDEVVSRAAVLAQRPG